MEGSIILQKFRDSMSNYKKRCSENYTYFATGKLLLKLG
jgi:hypothetical protein